MEIYLSKRAQLIQLTQEANGMLKNGYHGNHNKAILDIYRRNGHGQHYRTIYGWNRAGYLVETGERGLPLWGIIRPIL